MSATPRPADDRRTGPMLKGRQADSARRHQRVLAVLAKATSEGTEINVAGIARAAGIDRSFLYRHHDLLEQIHALEAATPPTHPSTATVTRASLQADLLAAHERAARLATRIQHLEHRLSNALGEHAWHQTGLGTPADTDALNQKILHLEQEALDTRLQLEERDADLAAARDTNRQLMAQLNQATAHR